VRHYTSCICIMTSPKGMMTFTLSLCSKINHIFDDASSCRAHGKYTKKTRRENLLPP
jgi:hypothetical protein